MSTWFNQMPGVGTARTASHRTIFLQRSETFLAGGKLIDGTKSRDAGNSDVTVLRPGKLMGKITTGGLYRPCIIGKSTAAYADNDTEIAVSAATATEVARLKALGGGGDLSLKLVGPPSAAGTVAATAITVSAVTIDGDDSVLTVADLNLNKVTDSLITPADGSETPVTFIPDWDYGVAMTDQSGTSLAVVEFPKLPVSGIIDPADFIDWPADASTRAWIIAALNGAAAGQYVFTHGY